VKLELKKFGNSKRNLRSLTNRRQGIESQISDIKDKIEEIPDTNIQEI
jgi:chaperonin cofactor prefoldin